MFFVPIFLDHQQEVKMKPISLINENFQIVLFYLSLVQVNFRGPKLYFTNFW